MNTERRYDVDWLRVILFGLLIWFHYAVFSLGILFENRGAVEDNLPLFFIISVMHQWRLAALFVISGMGTAFAFRRKTTGLYLKERGVRLLVPLLFTTYLLFWGIATPIDATKRLLTIFPGADEMPYGHLWFVYNLLIYSVILTPLFTHIRNNPDGKLVNSVRTILKMPFGIGILIFPSLILALNGILFKPWAFGEVGMWWEFPRYMLYFLFGYLLISAKEEYFAVLDKIRIPVTIMTPILALMYFGFQDTTNIPAIMEGGWVPKGYPAVSGDTINSAFIQSFHAWFWCLLIFTWASKFLNKASDRLTYLNQSIYPAYIVHMHITFVTIIILEIMGLSYYSGLIVGTLIVGAICLFIFEIVKRAKLARPFFGIKEIPVKKIKDEGPGSLDRRIQSVVGSVIFHILSLVIVLIMMAALAAMAEG